MTRADKTGNIQLTREAEHDNNLLILDTRLMRIEDG